jgi:hypothetical protein
MEPVVSRMTSKGKIEIGINPNGEFAAQLNGKSVPLNGGIDPVNHYLHTPARGELGANMRRFGETLRAAGYTHCLGSRVALHAEEVDRLVTAQRQFHAERAAARAAELKAAQDSGEAFRAAEITEQFGSTLLWARRLRADEREQYSEWFRDLGMIGFAAESGVSVEADAVRQVIAERQSDGQFLGTTNQAWTINEDEWNAILALSREMRAKKAAAKAQYEAEEAADIERKIATGYCFSCESWCHGDCGHYSNDPMTRARRQYAEAIQEDRFAHRDED